MLDWSRLSTVERSFFCCHSRIVLFLLSLSVISPAAQALDKVRLQLRFDHQFQFAGYYAAQWQGYYAEAGLDVEFLSGVREDRSMIVVSEVVERGDAEFGIGAGDILLAIDRGAPLRIVASIFQQSPVELFARKDVQLSSPADLPKLKVLQDASPLVRAEIYAMLQAEGLPPASVHFLHAPARQSVLERIQSVLDGKVDVMPGYAFSIPWYAQEQGIEITSLRPAAYGVDFYGDSLFTTAALIAADPDLVKRFRDASIKGWQYVLKHPDPVIQRITDELPRELPVTDKLAYNRFLVGKVRVLMHYPMMEVGHVNRRRWERMHTALLQAGAVKSPLLPDDLIFSPERIREAHLRRLLNLTAQAAAAIILVGGVVFIVYLSRARAQAERNEKRYRGLFNDSPLSIWEEDFSAVKTYLDAQLAQTTLSAREFLMQYPDIVEGCAQRVRIVDVNQSAWRLYGATSKEEMLRELPRTFVPESHAVFRDELIALLEGNTEYSAETIVQSLTGQPLQVELRLSVLPEAHAQWDRVVVLITDISTRRHAEAMLRRYGLMVSITADMMAYVDRDYRYQAVNEGYCLAFNTDKDAVVGSTVESLLGEEVFLQAIKPKLDRCLAGENVCYELEIRFPGTGFRIQRVNYYPVISGANTVEGVVVHIHDMTEIKRLEQELLEHQNNLENLVADRTEKLSQALQELESFSYSVSHDLRSPLRSINGFCTALMEDCGENLDKVSRGYLERVLKNVCKMEEQIDGLLRLSRITRGDMKPEHFDLSPIVRELVEKYQQLYPERLFETKIALSVDIYGDKRLLEIALDNLIGNAFKFSSRVPAPCIEFGEMKKNGKPAIYVRDNGVGFDMQHTDKLFMVFHRLQADYEGHGIGLATVQRVVLRHGGKLWGESTAGAGATFYFSLPEAKEVAEMAALSA